jgi:lipoate---protein ligase
MKPIWRLLDTGQRPAAQNIALNRAMLQARREEEIPNTLRFLRFEPCALLGYHQNAEQELYLDFCEKQGIDVQRRITGGGAIYFDPTHLGWELYMSRNDLGARDMAGLSAHICEAVAGGLRSLGVDARFRPRNDIEVNGRKISGTGGVFEGSAIMFQGTLLMECDIEGMLRVLRVPAEKLGARAVASLRERMVGLDELMGYRPELAVVKQAMIQAISTAFGVTFQESFPGPQELRRYETALREIDHPEWIYGKERVFADRTVLKASRKLPAGMIHVAASCDMNSGRIRQVCFCGDFFVSPARTIVDLEAALKDAALEKVDAVVKAFFAAREVDMLGLAPGDFVDLLHEAFDKAEARADTV